MSVELNVLFRGKLPSRAALNRAMKELEFPVLIPAGGGSLETHSGFLPMKLRREESGVEFDVCNDRADVEEFAGEFDPRFERSANFRWGGDEDEMLCALCTAAALAKLVNGVVLDEEGRLSVDQAIAQARETLKAVKPADPRYGTRPADIKRYLKPLLELRSDLVVVGRFLLIRPVRHLLRGALLDRTSDKYSFRVWRYVQPLFGPPDSCGYDDYIHAAWDVWQPHFTPLLIDRLATEVFDRWGPVTTLDGFATDLISTGEDFLAPVTCLALAGEWDRASEYVQQFERESPYETQKAMVRELWERVTTDIDAFCARLHAKEADTVKALKLEHIWEPSPFPVELPAAERARWAEPVFTTTPWIPPPSWLWQKLPTEPGDVRFAKDFRWRDGTPILSVALSREEAEDRHRNLEDYVMVSRLPDGLLLMIKFSGWDRNDPKVLTYVPTWSPCVSLRIALHGESHFATVSTSTDWDRLGVVDLQIIEVYERFTHESIWHCFVDFKEDEKRIHDSRSGETIYTSTTLDPTERELATCRIPAFGEYAESEARVRALLQRLGYGDVR